MRYAYDHGINFFDTAEGYGNGDSEKKIGEAMQFMDRCKIFIVTKLSLKEDDTEQTIRERFAGCLERMKTPYADALYTHSVAEIANVEDPRFHAAAAKLKADSKIRHIGISSHGPRQDDEATMQDVLLAAIDDGRFDLMLLVYNFMKKEEGERVLAACKEKDIGASIMKAAPGVIKVEPFDPDNPSGEYAEYIEKMIARGTTRPEAIERIQKWIERQKEAKDRTGPFLEKYGVSAEDELKKKSIQWVLHNRDAHTVSVSMRDFDSLKKFIPLSGTSLQPQDHAFLRDFERSYGSQYCRHGCNACASRCHYHLPVSTIMRYASYYLHQGRQKLAMRKYAALRQTDASPCALCSAPCDGACPHGFAIQASMNRAHSLLTLA